MGIYFLIDTGTYFVLVFVKKEHQYFKINYKFTNRKKEKNRLFAFKSKLSFSIIKCKKKHSSSRHVIVDILTIRFLNEKITSIKRLFQITLDSNSYYIFCLF